MMILIERDTREIGRLDLRVLVQLLTAWLLWLWQLLCSVRYLRRWYVTRKRRLPYLIDEFGDVTYRPPKREWLLNLISTDSSIQNRLIRWINSKIPNHRVTDMTSSWADGIALCALVEELKPGACPRHDMLKPNQKLQNCRLGLKLVHKYFNNIPITVITPEEMAYCRDAKKMRQLLLLVRYYTNYPMSTQLIEKDSKTEDNCWAKGEGLRHGLVGKKVQFVIQTPVDDYMHLTVEIQGPNGEIGKEEITTASPLRKTCKFFDVDSDGREQADVSDDSIHMDYQCIGEGRFAITYLPQCSGHYNVSIQWHQTDIPGSPFTARVDDQAGSLRDGNIHRLSVGNLGVAETDWNYEQYGSTVIRRRSVAMETGRRLSILAQENEKRKSSLEEDTNLTKQRTVTRRRVIKRVMTLGGREVTLQNSYDAADEQTETRRDSMPKMGLFETVAMAIKEKKPDRAQSPSMQRTTNFETDAYEDTRLGKTPLLKDMDERNTHFFQQIQNDSPSKSGTKRLQNEDTRTIAMRAVKPMKRGVSNNEIKNSAVVAMETARGRHKNDESPNSAPDEDAAHPDHVRSRNTSGGDSGIDLTNGVGKKLAPKLEAVVSASTGSEDVEFKPEVTSTPESSGSKTDEFASFEAADHPQMATPIEGENFRLLQSQSMRKFCMYMTGKNVTGTLSAQDSKPLLDSTLDLGSLNLEEDPKSSPKFSPQKVIEEEKEEENSHVKKSNSSELGQESRSSKARRRSRPKSPRPDHSHSSVNLERFFEDVAEQQMKVAQRGSLTRQDGIPTVDYEDRSVKSLRDASNQVTSDQIKRDLGRRVKRKKYRKREQNYEFGEKTESESAIDSRATTSDMSDYMKLPNFQARDLISAMNTSDEISAFSTDDVTLPSMKSSLQSLSVPTKFKFRHIETDNKTRKADYSKRPKRPLLLNRKFKTENRRTVKNRLESRVIKWLRSQIRNVDIIEFKERKSITSLETSKSLICDTHYTSSPNESRSGNSSCPIPCECLSYLENKQEYLRFFGELFDSELCPECVEEFNSRVAKSAQDATKFKAQRHDEFRKIEPNTAEIENSVGIGTVELKIASDVQDISNEAKNREDAKIPSPILRSYDPLSSAFLDKNLLLRSQMNQKQTQEPLFHPQSDALAPKFNFPNLKNDSTAKTNVYETPFQNLADFGRKSTQNSAKDLAHQETVHYEYRPSPGPISFNLPGDDLSSELKMDSDLSLSEFRRPPQPPRLSPIKYEDMRFIKSTETRFSPIYGGSFTNEVDKKMPATDNSTRKYSGQMFRDQPKQSPLIVEQKPSSDCDCTSPVLKISPNASELQVPPCRSSTSTLNSKMTSGSKVSTSGQTTSGTSCVTCHSDTTSSLPYSNDFNRNDSMSPTSSARLKSLLDEIDDVIKRPRFDEQEPRIQNEAYKKHDFPLQNSSPLKFRKSEPTTTQPNWDYEFEQLRQLNSHLKPVFGRADSFEKTPYYRDRDTPTRRRDTPTRHRDTPTRHRDTPTRPTSTNSIASIVRQFLMELDELVRKHGRNAQKEALYDELPNPAMCRAMGVGLNSGHVGVKNNFQIRTHQAGNGTLSVSIHGPSPHTVTETIVLYTGDDLYEVLYLASKPGYYIISVKWSDVNVPNSPFICKIEY